MQPIGRTFSINSLNWVFNLFIFYLPDYENYLTNEVKYFFKNSNKDFCENVCTLMAKLNQALSI